MLFPAPPLKLAAKKIHRRMKPTFQRRAEITIKKQDVRICSILITEKLRIQILPNYSSCQKSWVSLALREIVALRKSLMSLRTAG
jgi:hypothetical protein